MTTKKTAAAQASEDTTRATKAIWRRHRDAWDKRDLEALVSDYSPTAILFLNHQTYVGQPQIRKAFQRLFEIFDQGEEHIDTPTIKDRIAYITWHFSPGGRPAVFGSDTFVVENHAISYQTTASPLYEEYPVPAP